MFVYALTYKKYIHTQLNVIHSINCGIWE